MSSYRCHSFFCPGHSDMQNVKIWEKLAENFCKALQPGSKVEFQCVQDAFLQLKNAQILVDQFQLDTFPIKVYLLKLPRGFCLPADGVFCQIANQIEPLTISMARRLYYVGMVRQAKVLLEKVKNIATNSLIDATINQLEETERNFLTFHSCDPENRDIVNGLPPGLEKARPFLSKEQLEAIKFNASNGSKYIPVEMCMSIVKTFISAPLMITCRQVPQIADFPPGILSLCLSYMRGPHDDISDYLLPRS